MKKDNKNIIVNKNLSQKNIDLSLKLLNSDTFFGKFKVQKDEFKKIKNVTQDFERFNSLKEQKRLNSLRIRNHEKNIKIAKQVIKANNSAIKRYKLENAKINQILDKTLKAMRSMIFNLLAKFFPALKIPLKLIEKVEKEKENEFNPGGSGGGGSKKEPINIWKLIEMFIDYHEGQAKSLLLDVGFNNSNGSIITIYPEWWDVIKETLEVENFLEENNFVLGEMEIYTLLEGVFNS